MMAWLCWSDLASLHLYHLTSEVGMIKTPNHTAAAIKNEIMNVDTIHTWGLPNFTASIRILDFLQVPSAS